MIFMISITLVPSSAVILNWKSFRHIIALNSKKILSVHTNFDNFVWMKGRGFAIVKNEST